MKKKRKKYNIYTYEQLKKMYWKLIKKRSELQEENEKYRNLGDHHMVTVTCNYMRGITYAIEELNNLL